MWSVVLFLMVPELTPSVSIHIIGVGLVTISFIACMMPIFLLEWNFCVSLHI